MTRALLLSIIAIVLVAGCSAPGATEKTTDAQDALSDPFAQATGPAAGGSTSTATPSSAGVQPTTLPPSPPPPTPPPQPTPFGYELTAWAVGDGTGKFVDASGVENPILRVPSKTTITIDLLRNGQMHGLYVGSQTVIPVGSNDTRASFDVTDWTGDTEYGCPVHVTSMRGILRVVPEGA